MKSNKNRKIITASVTLGMICFAISGGLLINYYGMNILAICMIVISIVLIIMLLYSLYMFVDRVLWWT